MEKVPDFFQEQLDIFLKDLDPDKGFNQRYYPDDFTKEFEESFIKYFNNLLFEENLTISKRGCLNFLKFNGLINTCPWHNENGINKGLKDQIIADNKYLCIFWLASELDKGGEFKFVNDDGNVIQIPMNPPGFMIFTRDTLHAVNHYTGTTYRISFNVDFE